MEIFCQFMAINYINTILCSHGPPPELEVGGGHSNDGVWWGKNLHGHKLGVPGRGELLDTVASLRVPQLWGGEGTL